MTPTAGVVIPIRGFFSGKTRLGGHLDPGRRADLLRAMAERVVAAAGPLPVAVVSSAAEVRAWAAALGVALVDDPGTLAAAAGAGQRWAARAGLARVVVAHADLPLAGSLAALAADGSLPRVVAVPCHHDDGTPVLSVPTSTGFTFRYGAGSFRRHAAEARDRRLAFRVVRDAWLGYDVDSLEDLARLPFPVARPVPGPASAALA